MDLLNVFCTCFRNLFLCFLSSLSINSSYLCVPLNEILHFQSIHLICAYPWMRFFTQIAPKWMDICHLMKQIIQVCKTSIANSWRRHPKDQEYCTFSNSDFWATFRSKIQIWLYYLLNQCLLHCFVECFFQFGFLSNAARLFSPSDIFSRSEKK